ncbi:MAG: ATP-binding cassette domain-containing protein, partial [Firmicutes bacterium]|nr:ATP-binding cassette domain-containing protein [Bacillota bacterium]
MAPPEIVVERLSVWFDGVPALRQVSLTVPSGVVMAIIGPSGCGKSTLLRVINRLIDRTPGVRWEGQVLVGGEAVLGDRVDLTALRRRVGMVFQRPNPFPFSIFDNVAYGPRLHGLREPKALRQVVEASLKQAALWDEVRGKLRRPAASLS